MSHSIIRSFVPITALLLTTAIACNSGADQTREAPTVDTAQAGAPPAIALDAAEFRNPESVLYDSVGDVYFVSNVDGDGDAVDNNGFISRVRPDGSVDSLHFVLGGRDGAVLNAPKGMAIVGNTLWVADLDALRAFDRRDGRSVGSIGLKEQGARFLNDLALGSDGALYASDTRANRIFRVGPNLRPSVPVSSDSLRGPNGLLWLADTTAVAGATPDSARADSTTIARDSSRARRTTSPGDSAKLASGDSIPPRRFGLLIASFDGDALMLWNPADSSLETIAHGVGGFDGLARLPDGRIVVSSLSEGGIYVLERDSLRLLSDVKGVADLTADPRRNRLILPLIRDNTVRVLDVSQLADSTAGG